LKAGINRILLFVKDPINLLVVDQKGACQEIYSLPTILNTEWLILNPSGCASNWIKNAVCHKFHFSDRVCSMVKLAVKIGIGWVMLMNLGCTDVDNTHKALPQKLGDLTLSKVIQGSQADGVIHKMHGKKLGASWNFIGYYGNEDAGNILYLSIYEDIESAKADLMKMAMKMAGGTRVFAPLTFGEMGDNVRFRTEGMGFAHNFYRIDNMLIWWQVDPQKVESTLKTLLSYDFTALKKKAASPK
jgi:hypothetical protein